VADLNAVFHAVGIDVGGLKKGYHAVVNSNRRYHAQYHSTDPHAIAAWAKQFNPSVIAVDAPCLFSRAGRSRSAERALVSHGLRCFYTPTRAMAEKSRFYDWVFNGERLYQALGLPLFNGLNSDQPCVIETFPHGIATAYQQSLGEPKAMGNKSAQRLNALSHIAAYDTQQLNNIDFIDAALCAVAADYCVANRISFYGDSEDGYIVIPRFSSSTHEK
jgi:predicted nuclease with RNAse H fold